MSLRDHQRVHFVGIGGIGMSALARFLLASGYQVSGSDRSGGEQAEALSELGALVHTGHRAQNLDGADLVVITSAIAPDNPELLEARARNLPIVKRAQLLAEIVNAGRGVAVAGTHGKTTTSALIGHLLVAAGLDPTILIGGVSASLGSNARVGAGDLVVAEADEYDASFLHLRPEVAVITNVEPEHLDFYGSPQAVFDAFGSFAAGVTGALVLCADDPVAASLRAHTSARVVTYGLTGGEWRASLIDQDEARTRFAVRHGPGTQEFSMRLAGRHNLQNALAALAAAAALGVPTSTLQGALPSFSGVARRLETKGEAAGVLVVDSYAHHPTEIRADLAALGSRFQRPVRLIFQPHTYSRTRSFLADFARSFDGADAVYLLDVYAARETDTLGVSGRTLANAAALHHPRVTYTATMEAALDAVVGEARPGDLVVTMGAGDVYQLAPRILKALVGR